MNSMIKCDGAPSDHWANGDYVDVLRVVSVVLALQVVGPIVSNGMGVEFRDKKCVEVKYQQDDIPGI